MLDGLWLDEQNLSALDKQPQPVRALMLTMAAKDWSTYLHQRQVAAYTGMLAQWLKLPQEQVDFAELAGLLHDIGKVAVPDQILTKPGRLTDEESQAVSRHAEWGFELLSRTGMEHALCTAAMHHHEWFDGRGYPGGLVGHGIPFLARMIAVADAFDSMTAPHTYRRQVPLEWALHELERCAGSQFDPELTEVFVAMVSEGACAGVSRAQRKGRRPQMVYNAVEPLALRLGR